MAGKKKGPTGDPTFSDQPNEKEADAVNSTDSDHTIDGGQSQDEKTTNDLLERVKMYNAVIEKLAQQRLTGEQWRVVMVVIRQTVGWGKTSDWISLSQFSDKTGLAKRNASRAIQELKKRNIIGVKYENKKQPRYRINKRFEQWRERVSNTRTKESKNPENKQDIDENREEKNPQEQGQGSVKYENGVVSYMTPTSSIITSSKQQQQKNAAAAANNFDSKKTAHRELSADERELIRLTVERKQQQGEQPKKSWGAFRTWLEKEIRAGNIDVAGELAEIRAEIAQNEKNGSRRVCEREIEKMTTEQVTELIERLIESRGQAKIPVETAEGTHTLKPRELEVILRTKQARLYERIELQKATE